MLCCAVQIENEYGYYGHDKLYLRHLVSLVRQHMGQGVSMGTRQRGWGEGGLCHVLMRGEQQCVEHFSIGLCTLNSFGGQGLLETPRQPGQAAHGTRGEA